MPELLVLCEHLLACICSLTYVQACTHTCKLLTQRSPRRSGGVRLARLLHRPHLEHLAFRSRADSCDGASHVPRCCSCGARVRMDVPISRHGRGIEASQPFADNPTMALTTLQQFKSAQLHSPAPLLALVLAKTQGLRSRASFRHVVLKTAYWRKGSGHRHRQAKGHIRHTYRKTDARARPM